MNSIVTLGEKGCIVNGAVPIPAIKTKALDTTGAGDTFNVVLAVCIAEGMDLTEASKCAVTASGLSVTKKYVINAIPTKEDIERFMKNE